MHHGLVEFILIDSVSFEHIVSQFRLLNHHLHHAFHWILILLHLTLVAHQCLHAFKFALFRVKEDFLGLLLGELCLASLWCGHLSLHEDLLGLGVREKHLLHLHKLLLAHSDVVHAILKDLSKLCFLLLDHLLYDFLVFVHLIFLQ